VPRARRFGLACIVIDDRSNHMDSRAAPAYS